MLKEGICSFAPKFFLMIHRTTAALGLFDVQSCCARHQSPQLPFANSINVWPDTQKNYGCVCVCVCVCVREREREREINNTKDSSYNRLYILSQELTVRNLQLIFEVAMFSKGHSLS